MSLEAHPRVSRGGDPPWPLPVAQLVRRSWTAKRARERRDAAYFAWEASLRLATAVRLSRDTEAPFPGAELAAWAAVHADRADPLPERVRAAADVLGGGDSVAALFDAVAAFRAGVVTGESEGDGATLDRERDALVEGLRAAWRGALFVPRDARLAAVFPHGRHEPAEIVSLDGERAEVLGPDDELTRGQRVGRGVFLVDRGVWRALSPWLVYRRGGERDWEGFFFLETAGERPAYLDFQSGERLTGAALERAFPSDALRAAALCCAEHDAGAGSPTAFGDYEILGRLGEGGMGIVYLARQLGLGRLVALKLLHPGRSADPHAIARFRREILALSKCDHPNVVKIHGSGCVRDTWYYAMEFVDGADLSEVARELASTDEFESAVSTAWHRVRTEREQVFGSIPDIPRRVPRKGRAHDRAHELARYFRDAARAVQHLHDRGILHRDLKPSNLMVTHPDQRAVVMDLGLAAVSTATTELTGTGQPIVGTLRYLAPERVREQLGEADGRADVYALGASLYELLADRPFFDGDSQARLLEQVLHDTPRPLRQIAPSVPRDLATIVQRATEKVPDRRYASASALAEDLEAFLEGRPIAARPPTFAYLARLALARHRVEAATVLAASIALALGAAGYVRSIDRERGRTSDALTQLQELSDRDAVRLVEEADRLFPIDPRTVPRIDRWLARSRDLASRRERYAERRAVARGDELVELTEQVAAIDDLIRRLPALERRRERCASIAARTLDPDAWSETIDSIARNESYRRPDGSPLVVAPQLGLLPLQENPSTGLWEFWLVASGDEPACDPDTGEIRVDAADAVVFVLLPGAVDFVCGSEDPEQDPRMRTRVVDLDPFFIARFEVTQAQYERVMGRNPSSLRGPTHPVESVSALELDEAARRLAVTGPTEAQWEYAGRGGTRTALHWGSLEAIRSGDVAMHVLENLRDRSYGNIHQHDAHDWDDGFEETSPVGSFPANAFGLHDVHGNVREWCLDDVAPDFVLPATGLQVGNAAWLDDDPGTGRVLRGGFFGTRVEVAVIVRRWERHEWTSHNATGGRFVRALDPDPDLAVADLDSSAPGRSRARSPR